MATDMLPSSGASRFGTGSHARVNCRSSDQAPFTVPAEPRTRQKYDALSSVVGGEYWRLLTVTAKERLFAQSPFGLTCSSYCVKPDSGCQRRTTSVNVSPPAGEA